jgi:hypothetical protein
MRKTTIFAIAGASILAGVAAWAATSPQARVDAPTGNGIDPLQIMTNAQQLPAQHYADCSVIFN